MNRQEAPLQNPPNPTPRSTTELPASNLSAGRPLLATRNYESGQKVDGKALRRFCSTPYLEGDESDQKVTKCPGNPRRNIRQIRLRNRVLPRLEDNHDERGDDGGNDCAYRGRK